ncbi:MAG: putative alpha/beta-hydrolase family hydrolase [Myxococcota bacterium]|jgi:predicted alpha/beta-hydrolase family hydrolase
MTTPLLRNGPTDRRLTVVLAHGAGAPMDSDFMNHIAAGLAAQVAVVRFEFPYMHRRRTTGKRAGPGSALRLLDFYRDVIAPLGDPGRLIIGGKSMGGRIASMIADDCGVAGLICLGYPFHPAKKPDRLRTAHLATLATPALILQGERDPMGRRDEVAGYTLSPAITVSWIPDGDHSFVPRKSSGHTRTGNLERSVLAATEFITMIEGAEG